jgi:predicted Zn-dependent protease
MQLLDVLTINEELKDKEDLLEIVWEAFDYFPEGVWESIKHLGNVTVKHDLKIKSREKVYGAFVFDNLMGKVREMKEMLKNENLLLAVTHDPVIAIYHRFEVARFKRIVNLVRDYVSKEVGIVSLFEVEDEAAAKVAAHGLGHNQDLKHHAKPIDLMYARLLNGSLIKKDGFCDECQRKLKNRISI